MQLTATVPFDADNLTTQPKPFKVQIVLAGDAAIHESLSFDTLADAVNYAAHVLNAGHMPIIVSTRDNCYITSENYEQYAA